MAGQIKRMLDSIINQRAKGNPTVALTTKTKLILKGVNPDRFSSASDDDPAFIAKVQVIAAELGMCIRTAYSTKELPEAVAELKQRGEAERPRVVLYFASTKYDPVILAAEMQKAFPSSILVGCTTAGEIITDKMLNGSVVAMFLDSEVIEDASCAVVENVSAEPSLTEAFGQFEEHFKAPLSALDAHKYLGIVLIDGLSGAEECLMEKIGDLTDLVFVGGSAADDLKFEKTHVFANGKAFSNAAILLVLKVRNGFDVLKTQSFRTTGKTLVANEVDTATRRVIQLNGRPALDAYAEAIGVTPEQAPSLFMRHPLGLMVGEEPFVRSPRGVQDRSILFYCQIREGMELEVLEAKDIVTDTRQAVEAKKAELRHIAGLIDFQCFLRTLQLRTENQCEKYGEIFSGIPTVGFGTYGEEYLGHINQTSTMLLFR